MGASADELAGPQDYPHAVQEPSDGSILGNLRQRRAEAAQEADPYLVLDIPGYEPPGGQKSALAVVYRHPQGGYKAALKALEVEFQGKGPDKRLEGNADLLIACCACIVGQDEQGQLYDLRDDSPLSAEEALEHANPLRFNAELAEKLGIVLPAEKGKVGRFVVRQVFNREAQATGRYLRDLAIIGTGNAVFAWLGGANVQAEEVLEGE